MRMCNTLGVTLYSFAKTLHEHHTCLYMAVIQGINQRTTLETFIQNKKQMLHFMLLYIVQYSKRIFIEQKCYRMFMRTLIKFVVCTSQVTMKYVRSRTRIASQYIQQVGIGIRRETVRSYVISRKFKNGSTKPLLAIFVQRSA